MLETIPAKQKQRRPCSNVISAKYPPKVKLENFHNSRVPELGEIMRILVCEGFEVFIVGRVNIRSLA